MVVQTTIFFSRDDLSFFNIKPEWNDTLTKADSEMLVVAEKNRLSSLPAFYR